MSTRRDPRREDLVVPYVAPAKSAKDSDMAGTMTSSLPMAAMFTRNKMIGWTAVIFSLQNWLAETPEQKRTASTPGLFQVGMSILSVIVAYLPLFLPPPPGKAATGIQPPAAAPPP